MANRRTYQFIGNNIPGVSHIYVRVNIGAAGAPTLVANNGFISAMVRNSAGDYTITLTDAWNALLGVQVTNVVSAAAAAPDMRVKTNSVTSKSLGIVFSSAGTATDPASGEILLLDIVLKNSSI